MKNYEAYIKELEKMQNNIDDLRGNIEKLIKEIIKEKIA